MSRGVIVSEKEISLKNFRQMVSDEGRIKEVGLIFCQSCDSMVALIMPSIKKIIKENADIASDFKKRDAYIGNNSRATVCIHKVLEKNFEDYERLTAEQKTILLTTIADRLEGAYLGTCDRFWHRSWQSCSECPFKDVCISPSCLSARE